METDNNLRSKEKDLDRFIEETVSKIRSDLTEMSKVYPMDTTYVVMPANAKINVSLDINGMETEISSCTIEEILLKKSNQKESEDSIRYFVSEGEIRKCVF